MAGSSVKLMLSGAAVTDIEGVSELLRAQGASRYHIPGFSDIGQKAFGVKTDDYVSNYTQQYARGDAQRDERIQNAKSIAESFYTLVTDFYEYGFLGHFKP